jgi:hypothetical protein
MRRKPPWIGEVVSQSPPAGPCREASGILDPETDEVDMLVDDEADTPLASLPLLPTIEISEANKRSVRDDKFMNDNMTNLWMRRPGRQKRAARQDKELPRLRKRVLHDA